MKKGILFAAVFWMVSAAAAWADATGSWDISGQVKMKVAIKGEGSQTVTESASDWFVFAADGSFEMTDFGGRWNNAGKKILVNLDTDDLEAYFVDYLEDGLSDEGLDVEITGMTITVNTFSCKENKNGTLKGSWKLVFQAVIYVPAAERVFALKANSKTTFTGTRAAVAGIRNQGSQVAGGVPGEIRQAALIEAIGRQIQDALSAPGAPEP